MDYKTFTNDLANYYRNLESWKKAKDELEVILYDLCNVRGVSYDSIMVHGNPSQKALNWLTLDERYNDKVNEVERYEVAIRNVHTAKRKLPKKLWLMLKEIYVDGQTFRSVGLKYGYSDHGLWQMLRREVEKYI